jgi:hypothetical protein
MCNSREENFEQVRLIGKQAIGKQAFDVTG